ALAAAEESGVPPSAIEFQTLYGMADPVKQALVSLGRPVRVYTPYGQLLPGMAYLVRRLLENTSNESFLRASFRENVPEEQLLMNPQSHHNQAIRERERPGADTPTPPAHSAGSPAPAPFVNEPLTDFSREENRTKMLAGLEIV